MRVRRWFALAAIALLALFAVLGTRSHTPPMPGGIAELDTVELLWLPPVMQEPFDPIGV